MKKILKDIKKFYSDDNGVRLMIKVILTICLCPIILILLGVLIKKLYGLLIFFLLGCLFFSDTLEEMYYERKNRPTKEMIAQNNQKKLAELIAKILYNNAQALQLIAPKVISDINTTNDDAIRMLSGIYSFRFVVMKKSDFDMDYQTVKLILQAKVNQALMDGKFPDAMYVMQNGIPYINIIDIDDYLYIPNHLSIDIMLNTDDISCQYIKQHSHSKKSEVLSEIIDMDF